MTRKIVTKHIFPPIPTRMVDWSAHYDGEEEAGNYGWGATEAEAIADFVENYQEEHDERLGPEPDSPSWLGNIPPKPNLSHQAIVPDDDLPF